MATFGFSHGDTRITISGERELQRAMKTLPRAVAEKVSRDAVMAGGGVIKRAAVANAQKHSDTGTLAKSIVVKRKKYRGVQMAIVGPKHMKKVFRISKKGKLRGVGKKAQAEMHAAGRGKELYYYDPANYAHLVERGTRPHGPKKKRILYNPQTGQFYGRRVRGTPARPFMRPAFDSQKGVAMRRINEKLLKGIDAEARKLAARQLKR